MFKFVFKGVLAAVAGLLLFGCSQPPQEKQVSYKTEISPILQQYCVECHKPGGKGTEKSGLDMSSYDTLMKGTKFLNHFTVPVIRSDIEMYSLKLKNITMRDPFHQAEKMKWLKCTCLEPLSFNSRSEPIGIRRH